MIPSSDLQQKPIFLPCKPLRDSSWKKSPHLLAGDFLYLPLKTELLALDLVFSARVLHFPLATDFFLKHSRLFSEKMLCSFYPMVVIITMNLYLRLEFIWHSA